MRACVFGLVVACFACSFVSVVSVVSVVWLFLWGVRSRVLYIDARLQTHKHTHARTHAHTQTHTCPHTQTHAHAAGCLRTPAAHPRECAEPSTGARRPRGTDNPNNGTGIANKGTDNGINGPAGTRPRRPHPRECAEPSTGARRPASSAAASRGSSTACAAAVALYLPYP